MQTFKVGDSVSVLDDTISGKSIRIHAKKCVIEDLDGFERIYPISKIVLNQAKFEDYQLGRDDVEKQILQKINVNLKKTDVVLSQKITKTHFQQETLEIDLHIEELVEDHSYMSNFDILQRQMQTCRMFIERAIRLKAKKAVLIHGKGEGVLRNEIYTYLNRLENTKHIKMEYHEASYASYGVGGATEVRFL